MNLLPKPLQDLIEAFSLLPGVGQKTAERYAYYLLKQSDYSVDRLSKSLSSIKSNLKFCPITFAIISIEDDVSILYSDPSRNKKVIVVVAEPFDIIAIEKTNKFSGTYHVLGGLVSPLDDIHPENLRIKELIDRIKKDKVEEIILATNTSVEGETTSLYIQRQVQELPNKIIITKLARGLPIGLDIEYADQVTLSRALENRQEF